MHTVKPETISRWVREGKLTEREAALVRGSASARGFRGHKYELLRWLEDRSPGVSKRLIGDSVKGWARQHCASPRQAGQSQNSRSLASIAWTSFPTIEGSLHCAQSLG
jgi:hypothetical protein